MATKKELEFEQILDWFKTGEKKQDDWLIGTEHEKFILDKSSLLPLRYDEPNGIKDIFLELIKLGWKPIIGLDKGILYTIKWWKDNFK